MRYQANPVALPFMAAAAVSATLVVFAWRRRAVVTAPALAAMMAGEAAWALFEGLELVIADLPTKRLCFALRAGGAVTTILGLLAFVLRYTGRDRWLSRRRFGVICASQFALLVAAWTNPWHHLYWVRIRNQQIGRFWIAMPAYGPGFWVHFTYCYALVAASAILLAQAVVRSTEIYRAQAAVMLFGVLTPWVVNAIDLSQLLGYIYVDTAAMTFTGTGLALLPALFRFRLLDLIPVAHDTVVRGMREAVVVLDPLGRIVDLNRAARQLLGRPAAEIIGTDAALTFRAWPALAGRLENLAEVTFEIAGPGPGRDPFYDISVTQLSERVRVVGWVIVIRDISERNRAEQERARLAEEQAARAEAEAGERRYRLIAEAIPQMVWSTRPDGWVEYVNRRWIDYSGLTPEQSRGQEWQATLHPDDRLRVLNCWAQAIRMGTGYETECRLRRAADGAYRWHLARAMPLRDEGRITRWFGTCTDIDDQKRAEEAMGRYAERLVALHKIDQAILAAERPREIALAALHQLRLLIPAWHLDVVTFDLEAGRVEVLAASGVGESLFPVGAIAPLEGFGLESIEVLRRRQADVVEDTSQLTEPPEVVRILAGASLRSYARVPLATRGELLGCLDLFSDRIGAITVEHLEIAHEVADSLAIALRHAQLFEQVRAGRERLQILSRQLIKAQEDQRRYIARELHDEVGQALTVVKINLQAMARDPNSSAAGRMAESIALVERTLQQVRDLSLDLRPSLLDDLGLVAALRSHVSGLARRSGLHVQFAADPPVVGLAVELETACFRVAQEALTNVMRHARAKRAWVELRQSESGLKLRVADDGVGFDVEAARGRAVAGGSFGLLGMHERAELAGGRITIRSTPDRGTEVLAYFPLAPCSPALSHG
jgi:PAS domain S-box-containing protein